MTAIPLLVAFLSLVSISKQDCHEEVSSNDKNVTWLSTASADLLPSSEPPCYSNDEELSAIGALTSAPLLQELEPSTETSHYYDLNSCPPGYYTIFSNSTQYCYEITEPSEWALPCFTSGGASVITDLNSEGIRTLLDTISNTQESKFLWIPGHRQKNFNPVVWSIPGPNWGRQVKHREVLPLCSYVFKNCLLLDVENGVLRTETCNKTYPSLCFYLNDLQYPAKCPERYHAFRFMPDENACLGIENANNNSGLTYQGFLEEKCNKPMGAYENKELASFIFKKLAHSVNMPANEWCWFDSLTYNVLESNETQLGNSSENIFVGIINNKGSLDIRDSSTRLSCMACITGMIFNETQLILEYNNKEMKMYVTIYYPSGLWKYNITDNGIHCFSDGNGFVKSIGIEKVPIIESIEINRNLDRNESTVIKLVYGVILMQDRMAQYWCEGHTKNFTHLTTDVIVVNPSGNTNHVFALFMKISASNCEGKNFPDFSSVFQNLTNMFSAEQVLLMDIVSVTEEYVFMLVHLHVMIDNEDDEGTALMKTFDNITTTALIEFPKYGYTFVNLSSAIYCFPTKSENQGRFTLDWEITLIGQIAAPKQFCMQTNGLPVKRQCLGSYVTGGIWGPIEGDCDQNFVASSTTTFLYNVVTGVTERTNFLTDGLHYVLDDVDIIIPADIYYMSVSLDSISSIAVENSSSLEMGDLDNIAWVMDRLMVLDKTYLSLAQTLNSTNMILDSISEIIELFASKDAPGIQRMDSDYTYQLALKPMFAVQISYPEYNNITGLALVRDKDSDLFTEMTIELLYKNTTIDYVMSLDNLEIATWVPELVLDTLRQSNNTNSSDDESALDIQDVHVVIRIYHNDAVFQENKRSAYMVNSRIIEISIPGFDSNLEHSIPLVYKDKETGLNSSSTNNGKFCGYWDFESNSNNIKRNRDNGVPGSWKTKGCFFASIENNVSFCKCYHLTHFAQLISTDAFGQYIKDKDVANSHNRALNIITLIGSFMSLLGVAGIWITALTFSAWRQKPGTKVLLQLSTAISIPLMIIIFFNLDNSIFVEVDGYHELAKSMRVVCIGLGALLHYAILSGFVWMLLTAILQFMRYVRVLGVSRPSRFMLKLSLIGWGTPILPVLILLLVNSENYIPYATSTNYIHRGLCYPQGFYLIFTVLVPIVVILIVNMILFLLVMNSISRGPDGKIRVSDLDLVRAQLRLSMLLFFLLGLTWCFGIFSFSRNLWWSYLFCITSTLQGFVLFVYFIVCDPATRGLWASLVMPQFRASVSSSRESFSRSSISSSSTLHIT